MMRFARSGYNRQGHPTMATDSEHKSAIREREGPVEGDYEPSSFARCGSSSGKF